MITKPPTARSRHAAVRPGTPAATDRDRASVRCLAEELSVDRERVETGRIRVRVSTDEHDETIELPLTRDYVEVERIAIGREVDSIPSARQEGDTLIVPVVEEVVVLRRKLVLKEEVHLRLVRATEQHRERVTLRRQHAAVERLPVEQPSMKPPSNRASPGGLRPSPAGKGHSVDSRSVINMAYQTMVAAFDTPDHAQAAVNALKAGGFHADDISIFDKGRLESAGGATKLGLNEPGIWQRIFGGDVHEHEAAVFRRTVAEGGRLVSVRVPDNEVAHATGILDVHRPIDVGDRAITKGLAPAPRVEAAEKEIAATPLPAGQRIATSPMAAKVHGDVLKLAEEQFKVGKEMVETGRTRVRRFTTEREVSSDVTLHDEHAEVIRRAVAEPASFKDVDWADSEIEVVETAEHALVTKTARVVEEIGLKKVGADHVETIHEKLRRQQAEVGRFDAAGKPIASPPPQA